MFSFKNEFNPSFYKDWKFWFELILGFVILGFLIMQILFGIWGILKVQIQLNGWIESHPTASLEEILQHLQDKTIFERSSAVWVTVGMGYDSKGSVPMASGAIGSYIFYWFSFFTHLSNILVAVWLLLLAWCKIYPRNEYRFLNYNWSLVVLTFITLTSVVYISILAPAYFLDPKQRVEKLTVMSVFFGISLHVVFPWSFIAYQVFINPMKAQYSPKEYARRKLWGGPLILTIYTGFILIRGEVRYQDTSVGSTRFPYFFFNIHADNILGLPGWAWFVIAVILILTIYFSASNFYNYVIWKKEHKKPKNKIQEIQEVQENKEVVIIEE
ncbi:hypothetical protein [Williamsoniiplasma luminosum]|uniref:Uncharacterized protein n=1 Tax=Williamsoniiplasma luminosum TaxID=214888 RepID=A0A2S0NJ94_9MOLU|nr:hypothetical protein [Williamsoniiplasma luminosum]AVP49084.1 MAG: hypothetical protein C5T88_00595 [Williamsoniiplasma luminosum]